MNTIRQRYRLHFTLLSVFMLVALILSACDTTTDPTAKGPNGNGGKGCTKIGVLLPETTSSDRWESKDRPLLMQYIKAAIPNAHIDYNNGQDNELTQVSQAETDLANGDCALVVTAHDSVTAAAIVTKARAQDVPVIAYDRLIQSKDLNYYVSFDNIKVGRLQGDYIASHYQTYQKDGALNIAIISGSQTDNNALLFSQGVHDALDPLLANNTLKSVTEIFTPDWSPTNAQAEMETALADQQDNIQIAYVANDDMAQGAINALKTANMNGKVLVTGQDATLLGLRNIIMSQQNMTVYKPIAKEAQTVGILLQAIYTGSTTNNLTRGQVTATYDGGAVPSILDSPISVDRSNMGSTVVADKYFTKQEICSGLPTGAGGFC